MSFFPTKILLATDGSEDAERALATAVNLAKSTDSELHVATVAPGYPSYDVRILEVAEELRRQAQNILDDQVSKIEQAGGKTAQTHLRMAERQRGIEHHPSDEIVRLTEEIGAGLIVMGSRGRGGVRRALMGGVSDSVVRHAHCHVMVVRGEAIVFPAKILLATDGSEEAELAAKVAAELAARTSSELHVTSVAGEYPLYELPDYPARFEQVLREQRRASSEVLDEQVKRVEEAGVTVKEAHLREGGAQEEIIVLGDELGADLVVVGSRGLGGIRRALMGSVSVSVVHHAHCPVLVVRKDAKQNA
jgi:nucleotide-binding universal stress UspA family protein